MAASSEPTGMSKADEEKVLHTPDPITKDFIFQQTMYRIKDPKRSLEFYSKVLGMRLMKRIDMPSMKFTVYFMGYCTAEELPKDESARSLWVFKQKATLELTHNWGDETKDGQVYHNGNSTPRGFGHIGISVPDVDKACAHFEKLGTKFIKKPNEGKMKGIAFIQDPDDYWIEILCPETLAKV